jgi:hypothetical protein
MRRFDVFRKNRNLSGHEVAGAVSDKEAEEMQALATPLLARLILSTVPPIIPQFLFGSETSSAKAGSNQQRLSQRSHTSSRRARPDSLPVCAKRPIFYRDQSYL